MQTTTDLKDLSLKDWMSDVGLVRWLNALSIPDAPARKHGVKTSLQFFQNHMPLLPPKMALNFLAAMDLSRNVSAYLLSVGEKIVAFRNRSESEYKLFYARSGASPHSSGINPHNRIVVEYRVHSVTPVLESHTTGTVDVWSIPADYQTSTIAVRAGTYGVFAYGGGLQLIVPMAIQHLSITHVGS